MNRSISNIFRFIMDECLPALIRDNRFFMYPFFYYAYHGKNIRNVMNFKSLVYKFTESEYTSFYQELDTISRNRQTDLNGPSAKYILNNLRKNSKNLVDIGCGKGFFLRKVKSLELELHGCDLVDKSSHINSFKFTFGNIENLPFTDKQFDIVTCFHTIEHIINLEKAISELKRIARKQLIIATPCQRYFYYTLDEHVNFFPFKEKLISLVDLEDHSCRKIWGDWVYIGNIKD